MPFNPYARRPVERVPVSRSFEDGPDSFTLTFEKPGQIENCAANDLGEALIAKFPGEESSEILGWPPIGGKIYKVTRTAVMNAAAYAVMQPDEAEERYTAEEFVAFQAVLSDDCWQKVAAFAREVRRGAAEIPPTFGAGTAPSSDSASGDSEPTPST